MDALMGGLNMILTPQVAFALFVGSIGGVIIGAIPGVGAAVAIAILLPATFSLEPIVGLTMLLGIYGSSMYGGALPAILINTPGTAVNALSTYDGYPMTKRGEALRALGLAYGASFAGGILSVIALILFAPVLAKIAPMLDHARYSSLRFSASCWLSSPIVGKHLRPDRLQPLGYFLGRLASNR